MRKLFLLLLFVLIGITISVFITNRKITEMTPRQKILRTFYPILTGLTRLMGVHNKVLVAPPDPNPVGSIHDLVIELNDGSKSALSTWKGKKLLIVNTASDCGYTGQYEALQTLQERMKDKLVVIGFPANDFKEQEKGNDEQIARFCKLNYGVTFPLAKKSSVVKGPGQNAIFRWLSDKTMNGWNIQAPSWNFSKYLIDERGLLIGYFDPSVTPDNPELQDLLDRTSTVR